MRVVAPVACHTRNMSSNRSTNRYRAGPYQSRSNGSSFTLAVNVVMHGNSVGGNDSLICHSMYSAHAPTSGPFNNHSFYKPRFRKDCWFLSDYSSLPAADPPPSPPPLCPPLSLAPPRAPSWLLVCSASFWRRGRPDAVSPLDRKSTRLNSSH